MERDEFRDFLLQIDIPRESGRILRFTLVRLISKSISSKLTDEKYISLRTIPFMGNYRFVLSSFTHSEYTRFKDDYYDQLDFLRFSAEDFRSITNIAFRYGFELDEYVSSGTGKLEIRAPTRENRSEYLLVDMENRFHEGFRPYLIKLSSPASKLRVRADFNIFLSKMTEQEAYLLYDLTESILSSHMETYEKLARFRSAAHSGHGGSSELIPEIIKAEQPLSPENLRSVLSGKFEALLEKNANGLSRIFLKEKPSGRWIATMNVLGDSVQIIPGLDPTLESMLLIQEIITEAGS